MGLGQRGWLNDAQKDQVMAESIESPSHFKSRPDVERPPKGDFASKAKLCFEIMGLAIS